MRHPKNRVADINLLSYLTIGNLVTLVKTAGEEIYEWCNRFHVLTRAVEGEEFRMCWVHGSETDRVEKAVGIIWVNDPFENMFVCLRSITSLRICVWVGRRHGELAQKNNDSNFTQMRGKFLSSSFFPYDQLQWQCRLNKGYLQQSQNTSKFSICLV